MSGRALLIGADHQDLHGVQNDVAAMAAALRRRGFDVRCHIGDEATRDGILNAYRRLTDEVSHDEPVVVYYSGHGGYCPAPELDGFAIQFLVPNDYDRSAAGDFRGITSVELSALHAGLFAKTKNLTIVLDCCHSGQMARDQRRRTKAVPPAKYETVKAHLDRLEADGLDVRGWRNEGNRDVVRLVACSPRQSAFEYENDEGRTVGVLTESLVTALTETEQQTVTWAAVMDRIRSRVVALSYDQRPEVEGPANRRLFELAEADLLMSLPVAALDDGSRVRLDCAPLLAVQEGDQFMIMPSGAVRASEAERLGDLTVDGVSSLWAEGLVVPAPGTVLSVAALTGARAFRTRMQAPRMRVSVPVDDPRAADLIAALDAVPLVETAAPDQPDWAAQVRIDTDGALSVYDHTGPLHPPRAGDPAGVERVAADLKILAQAAQLRRLVGSPWFALSADADVEWGRVVGGEAQPVGSSTVLRPGERIYVRVSNRGSAIVYVSMIDIGVSGNIALLTQGAPSGHEVRAGRSYTFGEDRRAGKLKGAAVAWPQGVAPEHGRPETILVIVTSKPQDLRALEQPGIARSRSRNLVFSPFQDLIDQLATGGARDLPPETGADEDVVCYDVHAVSFEIAPAE